jgi:hypothetical protein
MKTRYCLHVLLLGILIASVAACSNTPSETSAGSTPPAEKPGSFLDKFKPEPKVTIPAGTRLHVALIDGVSSNQSSTGDEFTASLVEPVIVNGNTVLAKGTKVRGRVVDINESGRVKGRASIQLKLTDIVRDNARDVAISTRTYTAVAESTRKRDAAIIGGGAGTGTVLATKGKEIHYGPETRLTFTLANSAEI